LIFLSNSDKFPFAEILTSIFERVKTTISIETDSSKKLALLIKVAREMGIVVTPQCVIDQLTVVAESSLMEAWESKEDDRWDEVYGNKKY
jgi:hypothetical protein